MNFRRMSGNTSVLKGLAILALVVCMVLAGCTKDPVSNDRNKNNQDTAPGVDFTTTTPEQTVPAGTTSESIPEQEDHAVNPQKPSGSEISTSPTNETTADTSATEAEDGDNYVPGDGIELPEDSWD